MRRICLALLVLFAAAFVHSQGFPYRTFVIDSSGHPVAGAVVRVCTEPATGTTCTPLANLFSDRGLTQAITNPTSSDSLGNIGFYVSCGSRYHVQISGPTIQQSDIPDINLCSVPLSIGYTALAFTATPTFDASVSSLYAMTLTSNVTSSTFSGGSAGSILGVSVCQDNVGGRTFAFPASVASSPPVPSISSGANTCTNYQFYYNGTNWVLLAAALSNQVISVFGRTGAVVAQGNDYSFAQVSGNPTTAQLAPAGGTANTTTFLRGDLSWQAPPVASVFGRTGAVTAQTGDYSFSNISGTNLVGAGGTGTGALAANAFFYGSGGSALSTLAAGGAGTNCMFEINGGTPQWNSCAGTASTIWSSLTNPLANLTLTMGTNTTTFNYSGLAGSTQAFKIDPTGAALGFSVLGGGETSIGNGALVSAPLVVPLGAVSPLPTQFHLVKLKAFGTPSNVLAATVADTSGQVVGICVEDCSSLAYIAMFGVAQCAFDGPTVDGDWVGVSTSVAGDCSDYGLVPPPTTLTTIGRVLSTNGGAGTYKVLLQISR